MTVIEREFHSAAELRAHYRAVHRRLWGPPPARVRAKPTPAPVVPPAPAVKAPDPCRLAALALRAAAIARLFGQAEDIEHPPPVIRIRPIIRAVAHDYGVSVLDILSARRTFDITLPRHVAMYLAKTLTLRSLSGIGHAFGGKDHTTVLSAINRIKRLAAADANFDARMRAIAAGLMLQAASRPTTSSEGGSHDLDHTANDTTVNRAPGAASPPPLPQSKRPCSIHPNIKSKPRSLSC